MAEFECGDIQRDTVNDHTIMAGAKPKVYKDGQYADPLYKKLSLINGEINRLTKLELQSKLKEFGLDTRGLKDVLRKRLKSYYKKRKLAKARMKPNAKTAYDYLAVIDFEATCDDNNPSYRHEIIEFPVVLIDVEKMEVVGKFHQYVRPVVNPKLTKFCKKLTGITQEQVDQSEMFVDVLANVEKWLKEQGLGEEKTFSVLTDGPWDMFRFMYYQCKESGLEMPVWSLIWINIRKSYCNFYSCPRGGIDTMLKNLGMSFEGSPHSGIDDATNIARIAIKLLSDGCCLSANEKLTINHDAHSNKTEVRYEAYHEPKYRDGEESDEKKTSRRREGEKQGQDELGEQDIVERLGNMRVDCEQAAEEDEDLDDLLNYYKIQKS